MTQPSFPIVVLISGNGSNLQALIDEPNTPYQIKAVISNKANAFGLERAAKASIPTHVILKNDFKTRDEFDAAIAKTIHQYNPSLIPLAGFMLKLGDTFVQEFEGKLINLHPSLLPKYPGLNPHLKVLENGDKEHGVSIHIVTEILDEGPLIAQASTTVEDSDTEESLLDKIHQLEHRLYPIVIKQFANGHLEYKSGKLLHGGQNLTSPLTLS